MPVKFRIFFLPSYMNTQKIRKCNTPNAYIPDFPVKCRAFCPPTGDYRKISKVSASFCPSTGDYAKFRKVSKLLANFFCSPIGIDGIFSKVSGPSTVVITFLRSKFRIIRPLSFPRRIYNLFCQSVPPLP